ncbi:Flagellar biosynthesis protein FlhF [hydrothermal vent metagenome]|uniref:Flagellar biosynthesis protein FlhF n=1 Tax=hydrothermal vent metagenome TaxID=652676 RepID=A0A3B1CA84_9ZZZZ
MKIKRFHAKDMRSTIRKVREELGADAVILSNRRAADGVEIIAAIDYDESLLDAQVPAATSASRDDEINIDASGPEIAERTNKTVSLSTSQREADDLPDVYSEAALNRRLSQPRQPAFAAHDFSLPEVDHDIEVQNSQANHAELRETPFIKETLNESPTPQQTETEAQTRAHSWSEEPSILAMQEELKSLRGLLVEQLSGLAWGQETCYHPLRARLLQRLLALGLSPVLAREIAAQCDEDDEIEKNWRCALARIAKRLPVAEQDILEQGGIIALVGATGVGKTTTVAKLAARYTLQHGPQKVLLITTDNNRVAAHEQLRSYARILGVPMRVAGDAQTLKSLIHGFADKGLILIDTAGMSQRDMKLSKQLSMITDGARDGGREVQIYLTLAANSQRGVLEDVAQAFNTIPLAGAILTKLDETTSLGGTLSVTIEQSMPVAWISDGQQVPEDLHRARPHSLVSRSVAIMQKLTSPEGDDPVSLTLGGMLANANG